MAYCRLSVLEEIFFLTWVERFNVQGSELMSSNRLNPKELGLNRGGK